MEAEWLCGEGTEGRLPASAPPNCQNPDSSAGNLTPRDEQTRVPPTLFDPNHGVGCQPVMSMNDVKMAHKILDLENPIYNGPTQVVDIIHEIVVRAAHASVIVNAVDPIVAFLVHVPAGEHMDLMSFLGHGRCQLAHVGGHSAHGNRTQCPQDTSVIRVVPTCLSLSTLARLCCVVPGVQVNHASIQPSCRAVPNTGSLTLRRHNMPLADTAIPVSPGRWPGFCTCRLPSHCSRQPVHSYHA